MTVRAFANLPGEMARRIREMDWSATALGSKEAWPQSLKLSIAMILASGFPMAIRWGPELILIYNDAYRPILRDKHPEALGRSLREVWWEVYPELGPLNESILRGERELPCTAWGMPTYNVKGWKGPCYMITDAHYDTFEELMTKTPWDNYGSGNGDPRCENCLTHCGYEASAAYGVNSKFTDPWKALSWLIS